MSSDEELLTVKKEEFNEEEEDDVLGWGGPEDDEDEHEDEGNGNNIKNQQTGVATSDDAAASPGIKIESNNNQQDASQTTPGNVEKDENLPLFSDEEGMLEFLQVVAAVFAKSPKMSREELVDKILASGNSQFADIEKKEEIKQRITLLLHNQIIMIDPVTISNLQQKLVLSPGAVRCLLYQQNQSAVLTSKERQIVLLGAILKILIQDQFVNNSNNTRLSMPRAELLHALEKLNPLGNNDKQELEKYFALLERNNSISTFETFSTVNSIFGHGTAGHYPVSARGHACALPEKHRDAGEASDEEFAKIKEANFNALKEIVVNPWQKAIVNFCPNRDAVATKMTLFVFRRAEYLRSLLQKVQQNNTNGVAEFWTNPDTYDETAHLVDRYYSLLRRCVDPDVTNPATILKYTHEPEQDENGRDRFGKPATLTSAQEDSLVTLMNDIEKICKDELMPQRDCLRQCERLGWSRNGYSLLLPHLFHQGKILRFKSTFGFTAWIGVGGKFKFPPYNDHALKDVQCAASGISIWIATRRIVAMNSVLPGFELNLCLIEQGWDNGLIRDALVVENSRRRFLFPTMTRGGVFGIIAGQNVDDDEKNEVWFAATEESRSLFERGLLNDPSTATSLIIRATDAAASSSSSSSTPAVMMMGDWTKSGGIGKPPVTVIEKLTLYLDFQKANLPPNAARFWADAEKVLPPNGEPMDKNLFAERLTQIGWVRGDEKIALKKMLESRCLFGACKRPGADSGSGIYLFKTIPGRNQPPEGFNRIGDDPHNIIHRLMEQLPHNVVQTGVFQIRSAPAVPSVSSGGGSYNYYGIGGNDNSNNNSNIGRMSVFSPEFAPHLEKYHRLSEQNFNPKLRNFWRDMCNILPASGEPVEKKVVSDQLNQVYGWKENSDHISCKSNLEDAFMIGAAKAAGSGAGSGIFLYRIVPGLRQPPPGLNRISRDPEGVPPMVERTLQQQQQHIPHMLTSPQSLASSTGYGQQQQQGTVLNRVVDVSNMRLSNGEFKCFNQLQEIFLAASSDGRSYLPQNDVLATLRGKYEWRDSAFLARAFDRYFSVGILARNPANPSMIRIVADQQHNYQRPSSSNIMNSQDYQQQNHQFEHEEVATVDIVTPALTPNHLFKPLLDASPKAHSLSLAQKLTMLETFFALSSASIAEGSNMQFLSVRKSLVAVRLPVYPLLRSKINRETVFNSLVARGFLKIYFPSADGSGSIISTLSIEQQIAQGRNGNDIRVALHDDFVRSVLAATNGNYSLLITPSKAILAQYDATTTNNNNSQVFGTTAPDTNYESGRRRSRSPAKYQPPQSIQALQPQYQSPPASVVQPIQQQQQQQQQVLYDAQGRAFVVGPNNQIMPLQQQQSRPPVAQPQPQPQNYYNAPIAVQGGSSNIKRIFLGPPNGSCITVPPPMLVRQGQWVQRPISSRLLLPPPPFMPVKQ
jgi:hypothetical protein